MRVGREFHIDSSHVLPGHPKCGVMHGHTYRIEVLVEGPDDAAMVLDFDELREVVDAFLEHLDHHHLNEVLDMPTVENLARYIHAGLSKKLAGVAAIRIWEGMGKYALFDPGAAQLR